MRDKWGLILVLGAALLVRVIWLASYPTSLSMDEVTFGYAGYSVNETLRDERGRLLPLYFEGMGDFKPPVDVYMNAVFIRAFGLSEWVTRLPGALLGTATVGVIYLILREYGFRKVVCWVGAGWLAVNPWHVLYSRAGYESVTALFFLALGLWAFLCLVRKGGFGWVMLLAVAFSLSVWSYHAERLYVPLMAGGVALFFGKEIWRRAEKWKPWEKGLVVVTLLVFLLPYIYLFLFTKGIGARAMELAITKEMPASSGYGWIVRKALFQYLGYFDLRFIFSKALNLTPPNYQGMGLLNVSDLPIFLVGAYYYLMKKGTKKEKLAKVMLFLGPVPAAFTRGEPSAIRILVWVPALAIIFAKGFETLLVKFGQLVWLWFVLASGFYFSYFGFLYTRSFPNFYEALWHYGYKEVARYVCENYKNYEKVVITDKYGIEVSDVKTIPHYYLLFYCRIDPVEYQREPELMNIEIRQPNWEVDSKQRSVLIIGSPRDFPENFDEGRIKDRIYFSNGKVAFYLVETGD